MSDLNNNQIGGYKATLHNPNVSEEAKQNAREVLDSAGASSGTSDSRPSATETGKDHNRVMGGYKATLSNPNASDEAKSKAEDVLQQEK